MPGFINPNMFLSPPPIPPRALIPDSPSLITRMISEEAAEFEHMESQAEHECSQSQSQIISDPSQSSESQTSQSQSSQELISIDVIMASPLPQPLILPSLQDDLGTSLTPIPPGNVPFTSLWTRPDNISTLSVSIASVAVAEFTDSEDPATDSSFLVSSELSGLDSPIVSTPPIEGGLKRDLKIVTDGGSESSPDARWKRARRGSDSVSSSSQTRKGHVNTPQPDGETDADDESGSMDDGEGESIYLRPSTGRKKVPLKRKTGRTKRAPNQLQCSNCRKHFADGLSLDRHRSAFKTHPKCLDPNKAPLIVYRCRLVSRGKCPEDYRDHRRDNVTKHENTRHPGELMQIAGLEIESKEFGREDLEALRDGRTTMPQLPWN